MFGHLRIQRSGLNADSRGRYHAQFCGGCHALREFGGRPASLLTNYDLAFLHLIVSSLENAPEIEMRACTALPIRKVRVQPLSQRGRNTVAALTIALVDAKLRDNRQDGHHLARAGERILSGKTGKAYDFLRRDGFPVGILESLPLEQARVEAMPHPTIAQLERPTARTMSAIFTWAGVVTEGRNPALARLGFALGRFLYLWDAVKDYQEDRKRGQFNALGAVYGEEWPKWSIKSRLENSLSTFSRGLDLLPLHKNKDIANALLQSMRVRLSLALREPAATQFPSLRLAGARHQAGFCECLECCTAADGLGECCSAIECCGQGGECCICCCPDQACCFSGSRSTRPQKTSSRTIGRKNRGNPP